MCVCVTFNESIRNGNAVYDKLFEWLETHLTCHCMFRINKFYLFSHFFFLTLLCSCVLTFMDLNQKGRYRNIYRIIIPIPNVRYVNQDC